MKFSRRLLILLYLYFMYYTCIRFSFRITARWKFSITYFDIIFPVEPFQSTKIPYTINTTNRIAWKNRKPQFSTSLQHSTKSAPKKTHRTLQHAHLCQLIDDFCDESFALLIVNLQRTHFFSATIETRHDVIFAGEVRTSAYKIMRHGSAHK